MKKLNNHAMTSIEMLISFVIVVAIVVGMFDVVMNYKNKQQVESIKNNVISYANSLQKTVQDDLIKGHVTTATVAADQKSVLFTCDRPSPYQTSFTIDVANNTISYGKTDNIIRYPLPEIPDLILSDASRIEFMEADAAFIKITIVLEHPNLEDKQYTFRIIAPIAF